MSLICRDYVDKTALILDEGREISYSTLISTVVSLSKFIDRGDLLFIIGSNDYGTIATYLAALEAHAVPLLLSEKFHSKQLDALVNVYKPKFIVKNNNIVCAGDKYHSINSFENLEIYKVNDEHQVKLHPELALLLTTSGSTGSAKLVRLNECNIVSNAQSISKYLKLDSDSRAITTLPYNYSYGLSTINSHLYSGGSLVLTNKSVLDAKFWKLFKTNNVTSLSGVPYTYEILLKLNFDRMDLPSLSTMTQAGGKMKQHDMEKIVEICARKNINFYSMYGQTEATARIAYLPVNQLSTKSSSIGIPIPQGTLWIENEGGELIHEPNQPGELVYKGPNVSMGYAERLEDLSLGDVNQGVLKTGDIAKFDIEGYFYIVGRKSRFLKIYGIRVSLDSVERVVTDIFDCNCAAYGIDDQLKVLVESTANNVSEDIKSRLSEVLGVNRNCVYVSSVEILPRLESGKVNYKCLL
jgi:acyl-CoA synthetase (AMP-forming)/AMP-acid ligase II